MSSFTLQLSVPRIFISGVSSNCSAEQLTFALASFLKDQGLAVSIAIYGTHFNLAQTFRESLGRFVPCLEPQLESFDQMLVDLYTSSLGAQIQLICSPAGFFDGPRIASFANSPAELAIRTGTPTILCINSEGLGNGIIPQIKGFKSFANGLSLAGIFNLDSQEESNQSSNPYKKLITEYFPDFLVINSPVKLAQEFQLPLGINNQYDFKFQRREPRLDFTKTIFHQLNIDSLFNIARQAPAIVLNKFQASPQKSICRIGVALDSAFNLLYQNNLILLRYLGAELISFSPLVDNKLPANISGLYLPGLQLMDYWKDLLKSDNFYTSLKAFLDNGGILYSEGTSFTLLLKKIADVHSESAILEQYQIDLATGIIFNQPKLYFSEAKQINDSLIGNPDIPVGFCLQNNIKNIETEDHSNLLIDQKTGIFQDLQNFHLLSRSTTLSSLNTNGYLNFSSNAIIPFNMINACRTAAKSA